MSRKVLITPLFSDADPLRQPWKPGEPLPTLIKVLRFGDNPTVKGTFHVTERTIANLSAQQAKRGREHVVIDFEHNTLPGTIAYKGSQEPRPVAARKGLVTITEDKCIALASPEWTKEGLEKAEHYADFSPAVIHDSETMEVIGIHSVGLVRNGAVEGLTFCTADGGSVQDSNQEDETMKELLAALIAAKMLPDGADEAAAVKLMVEMFGKVMAMPAETDLTADKVKTIAGEVADGKITPLSAELIRVRKDRIRDQARAEGKVIQLDETAITALSVEQLTDHVSKLPVTVPLEQRTRTTPASAEDAGGKTITPEQERIARLCGNDPSKVYGAK